MSRASKILLSFIIIFALGLAGIWGWHFWKLSQQNKTKQDIGCPYNKDFKWGVGVALFDLAGQDGASSWGGAKAPLDLAKELDVDLIRIGIPDWAMEKLDKFITPAIEYANSLNLNIVLLFEPTKDIDKMKNPYEDGHKWGTEISQHYKNKVCYYQIANELSGQVGKPNRSGLYTDDFDEAKYQKLLSWLEGAAAGIKQNDHGAKIVLTGHWLGVGIFEKIHNDDLRYDTIGWSWSQKFTDPAKVPNTDTQEKNDVYNIPKLLSKYDQEFWIIEADYPEGSKSGEEIQAQFLAELAYNSRNNRYVSGFFPFQLSDLPQKGDEPLLHGLVAIEKSGNQWKLGSKKQAFYTYQKIIAEDKQKNK